MPAEPPAAEPHPAETPPDARERLLAATYACVARFGMAKTTVEDVVKEAGVSRATVYRYFPGGRDELLRATVGWELARFFTRLAGAVQGAADLAHLLEDAIVFARRSLLGHDLLQKILATEPERLLPLLTTESQRTLPFVGAFLQPWLEREAAAGRLRPGVDVARAADHLARMVLSLVASPGRWDLDDPEAVRTLVREELLAGLRATV